MLRGSAVSTLFERLTAKPRRRVLVALRDAEPVPVPDGLSSRGGTRTAVSSAPRSLVEHSPGETGNNLRMCRIHLPKLHAGGSSSGTVSGEPSPEGQNSRRSNRPFGCSPRIEARFPGNSSKRVDRRIYALNSRHGPRSSVSHSGDTPLRTG